MLLDMMTTVTHLASYYTFKPFIWFHSLIISSHVNRLRFHHGFFHWPACCTEFVSWVRSAWSWCALGTGTGVCIEGARLCIEGEGHHGHGRDICCPIAGTTFSFGELRGLRHRGNVRYVSGILHTSLEWFVWGGLCNWGPPRTIQSTSTLLLVIRLGAYATPAWVKPFTAPRRRLFAVVHLDCITCRACNFW